MSAASGAKSTSSKKVAEATTAIQPPNMTLRTGVVSKLIDLSQVEVNISGSILVLPYLSSYSPSVGDNVQVLKINNSWIVIGGVGLPGSQPVQYDVDSSWNGTVGNGTSFSEYVVNNSMVTYSGYIIAGSTTVFPAAWAFDLPVQVSGDFNQWVGPTLCYDSSAAATRTTGIVITNGGVDTMQAFALGGQLTTTVPFTWAASDQFRWTITYRGLL